MSGTEAGALLAHARTRVPSILVGDGTWGRAERAIGELPRFCHSLFLECHLSEPSRRADLIARILPADRDLSLESPQTGENRWLAILARWRDPGDAIAELPFLDMESDLGGGSPVTFACPTLEPILTDHPSALEATRRAHEQRGCDRPARKLARAALRALYGGAIDAPLMDRLGFAFDSLPAFGSIHYANYLRCRAGSETDSLRIIACVPRPSFPGLLDALGWSYGYGWIDELEDLRCYRAWTNVDLDLTVGGLGPRLGFYETFFRPRATDRVLKRLIDEMVTYNLTTPEHGEALEDWVGQVAGTESLTLKVVCGPRGPSVKAYLEIAPPEVIPTTSRRGGPAAGGGSPRRSG